MKANGMCKKLKDRVAVVTAGGSGIGQGIAIKLSQEGADVVIVDLNLKYANIVAGEIKKEGVRSLSLKADVSNADEVEEMINFTIKKFGRIDILVNNAGINKPAPVWDVTEEVWDLTMKVNLKSVFLCSKEVIPFMMKERRGKIINISSISGKKGGTWLSPYCASKFGIIGFTQSIARELAPFNINVNAVCPGIVFTPLWNKLAKVFSKKLNLPPDKVKEYYVERIPFKRPASIDDIANVVTFLCSDEASYMTGQAINVTGGEEMR